MGVDHIGISDIRTTVLSGGEVEIVDQGLPDRAPLEVRQLDFVVYYDIKYRKVREGEDEQRGTWTTGDGNPFRRISGSR